MQSLSIDIETKILNDLDERIHEITRMGIERPELIKVISKTESDWSPEVAYSISHHVHLCPYLPYATEECIE